MRFVQFCVASSISTFVEKKNEKEGQAGIEPTTQGSAIPCSTGELLPLPATRRRKSNLANFHSFLPLRYRPHMRRGSKKGERPQVPDASTAFENLARKDARSYVDSTDRPKLAAWLKRYPETIDVLSFLYDQKEDQEYHNMRQKKIKEQIQRGFALISEYEKQCLAAPTLKTRKFFPEIKSVMEATELWRTLWKMDLSLVKTEKKLHKLLIPKYETTKTTIARLMSLLASIDAFLLSQVPIVNFEPLTLTRDQLIAKDPVCKALADKCETLRSLGDSLYERVRVVLNLKERKGLESADGQKNELVRWLRECRYETVDGSKCVRIISCPVGFMDILYHHQSKVHAYVQKFLSAKEKNYAAFSELEKSIASFCGLEATLDRAVLNGILLASFGADECKPDVKADGCGTMDDAVLAYGLELFFWSDPMRMLLAIAQRIDGQSVEAGVREAVEALKTITASYKELLMFVYEFTSPDYLGEKEMEIRNELKRVCSE